MISSVWFLPKWAFRPLLLVGIAYVTFILSLINPAMQRGALYLNWINFPFGVDLTRPNTLGFAENRVYPFTLDFVNASVFCWHVMPSNQYYNHISELTSIPVDAYDGKLHSVAVRETKRPRAVIYLHGTAGNIGTEHRLHGLRLYSSIPDTHVFAIDYRGFGLSRGVPSQTGLIEDAVGLVRYVESLGIAAQDIVVIGQSLGSAVAVAAAETLASDHKNPTYIGKVMMLAGFKSLASVTQTYRLGGFIPLLGPLNNYKSVQAWLLRYLYEPWDSSDYIAKLASHIKGKPTKIRMVHARSDYEIPCPNSVELFYAALNGSIADTSEATTREALQGQRSKIELSNSTEVFSSFDQQIKYLEVKWGGHNNLQMHDMVVGEIVETFL